jgi:hypothetical protein
VSSEKSEIALGGGGASTLEVVKVLITAFASIIIPAVIFFAGKSIEESARSRELALKYVEISVGILTEPPIDETKNLRSWAINNINKYAEIKLEPEAIKELKTEALPASSLSPAAFPQSQNFTVPNEPRKIKYIVVTDSEAASLEAAKKSIAVPGANASYHYIIGVDGKIEKIVPVEYIAWHAGRSEWKGDRNINGISIGIGLIHLSSKDGGNWMNLPSSHPAVGPNYPVAQTDALVALLADISKRHNIAPDAIITKQDIAPDRRRTDLAGNAIEEIRVRVRDFETKSE